MMESIIYASAVAIFGGFLGALKGSYTATKNGEEFDYKKFLNFVPKSAVGALMALGTAVVGGHIANLNVSDPTIFFGILSAGFAATLAIPSLSGNKDNTTNAPAATPAVAPTTQPSA